MPEFQPGLADQSIDVFIQDSSSTTGQGLSGLVYNSSGLKCYFRKGATGTVTQLTLATQTVGGAHSDGGFVELDATNMKGVYRLDLPDTVVADEVDVTLYIYGATNAAPVIARLTCKLRAVDVREVGGTAQTPRDIGAAVPASAPNTTGGLPVIGTGSNNFKSDSSARVTANTDQIEGTDATDYLATLDDAILTAISGLNNLSSAQAQSAAAAALVAIGLDHLLSTSVANGDVANNSVFAKLVSKSATAAWSSFNNETDSMENQTDLIAGLEAGYLVPIQDAIGQVPREDNDKTFNSTALASINAEVDTALNTAIPGSPTAGSINERVKTMDDADMPASLLALLNIIAPHRGTIGATGNDTTHLHLSGIAWGNDEPNDMLLLIYDVSTSLYYTRWIEDWVASSDLATVALLPFTPQASTDTYWVLPIRRDVTASVGDITIDDLTVTGFTATALAQLAGLEVNISPNLAAAYITPVVAGDDYVDADDRAYTITLSGLTTDFTGFSAHLYWELGDEQHDWTASSVNQSGSDWIFKFEPTSAETDAMTLSDKWGVQLVAISGSSKRYTLLRSRAGQVLSRFD